MTATTLALRPAPRTDPTPISSRVRLLQPPRTTPPGQGSLDLDFAPPALRVDPGTSRPPAGPAATALLQSVLEVLDGRRAPHVVQRSCSPTVYTALVRRAVARRGRVARHRAVARRLRVTSPRPGVCEAAAVVVMDERVRALAMCLAVVDGTWRLEALEIG